MSSPQSFGGNAKVGQSVLGPVEQRFIRWGVSRLPSWLRSWHLTLASIPISLLIILCGYLTRHDVAWLWGVSVLIVVQWFTDSFDGALGRYRKEGLIQWGYYMDHLLDYFFLAAILMAYMLILPAHFIEIEFFVFVIFAGYMVTTYLAMATTQEFRISYLGIGPTEIRLIFILINTLLFFFGKTYLAFALPYLLAFSFFGLIVVIYRTQRDLWRADMKRKDVVS
ncbi:MAG: CDP-alcohol phosphatidyltransferase family protein [Patescibacteria group bacterium]